MKIQRQPDGSLVVRENPAVLRGILICLGAAVLAAVALQEPREAQRVLLGALASLVPFAGAALLERVCFEFDVAQRRLRWSRRNFFRALSGELPFSEISGVELRVRQERDLDASRQHATSTHCVALRTGVGDLRLSDRRYADERETSEIAEAIRAVLGLPSQARVEDGMQQLLARRRSQPSALRKG